MTYNFFCNQKKITAMYMRSVVVLGWRARPGLKSLWLEEPFELGLGSAQAGIQALALVVAQACLCDPGDAQLPGLCAWRTGHVQICAAMR